MKILVTGSNGFIGSNLCLHLSGRGDLHVVTFTRKDDIGRLPEKLHGVDFVFHLAGVNRPQDPKEFKSGNANLTFALCKELCKLTASTGRKVPVIYTSSVQAAFDNTYGISKREAELSLQEAASLQNIQAYLFRLPNVFGKWGRPNYNSVVATFCHNISRGLPIQINDPSAVLKLVYIDDLVNCFISLMDGTEPKYDDDGFAVVSPQYQTTVGELASKIQTFRDSRETLLIERVGTGFLRALYSTYMSYLPKDDFTYNVPRHSDFRGDFVEVMKTHDSGQFSYFTTYPGVTRGGHYHHSKTEKFLVIKGTARFRFHHLKTGEAFERVISDGKSQIIETVPGWSHDVTNIGDDVLIVMIWANEVFDSLHPDTYTFAP